MFGAEDESLSQFFHLAASEAKCGEAGPLTAHCSLAPLPCPVLPACSGGFWLWLAGRVWPGAFNSFGWLARSEQPITKFHFKLISDWPHASG